MAQKRSRAQFEADHSFAVFGTPLPPLDQDVRDDGSYVPLWKQEAVDEQGRKRFHGAFTGGFSAGYYNTVGSKEGWTPATFKSSRTNRAKDQKDKFKQSAKDFMDEEDLADQEDEAAKKMQTSQSFAGLGSTSNDGKRRDALLDLMRSTSSMGIKLLQKMGWREGQGIGPKVRRKARTDDPSEGQQEHLFAPDNTAMVAFVRKTDRKGLGFGGEPTLPKSNGKPAPQPEEEDDDHTIIARSKSRFANKPKPKKSGIGVGILNDASDEEDDPYSIGPKISYNRSIGAVKKPIKKSKPTGLISSSNPLIAAKPVFKRKLFNPTSLSKCHDGLLPLAGFILASPLTLPSSSHPPPKVPPTWTSTKTPLSATSTGPTAPLKAKQSSIPSLTPSSRGSVLGETPLPSKSVFDFINPNTRARLVALTGNASLPAGRGESLPSETPPSDPTLLIPHLDTSTAVAALTRLRQGGANAPYAGEASKQARYKSFLDYAAAGGDTPTRAPGASDQEWVQEMGEFVRTGEIFRGVSGVMASRFVSSSSEELKKAKVADPAEEAAKMGMYGIMTRKVARWAPAALVCKRFGVRVPVWEDEEEEMDVDGLDGKLGNKEMGLVVRREEKKEPEFEAPVKLPEQVQQKVPAPVVVDSSKNDALEKERPGDAVFKAIFGSDDEDEDD